MKKFVLIFGILTLALMFFWQGLFLIDLSDKQQKRGVTFSSTYAEFLGLDAKKAYLKILDELSVKFVRLPVYWSRVEKTTGQYDFSEIDWQLSELASRRGKAVLVVGRRLPRWPECHTPDWAKNLDFDAQQKAIERLLTKTVERYRAHNALEFWQIENEPFLIAFGQCPKIPRGIVEREVKQVKTLDGSHPTIVTDSGELATWLKSAHLADYFGSTMYRVVWHPYFGYIYHQPSIPAAIYPLKAWLARKPLDKIMLAEVQAEPWVPGDIRRESIQEQFKSMDIARFKSTVAFAQKTGISRAYLWGAEWWYYLAQNGRPEFFEYAKTLF